MLKYRIEQDTTSLAGATEQNEVVNLVIDDAEFSPETGPQRSWCSCSGNSSRTS
jgi:hypothetical protein